MNINRITKLISNITYFLSLIIVIILLFFRDNFNTNNVYFQIFAFVIFASMIITSLINYKKNRAMFKTIYAISVILFSVTVILKGIVVNFIDSEVVKMVIDFAFWYFLGSYSTLFIVARVLKKQQRVKNNFMDN